MRSITTKLILAFLAINFTSVLILVLLGRFATNREFDKFVNNRYEAELVESLANYYKTNSSWNGIQNISLGFSGGPVNNQGNQPPANFSVIDKNGVTVRESFSHKLGEIISEDELAKGTPIQINDETVGYLLIERPPDRKGPMEDEFLKRLETSRVLTAIGTILLALLFGAILSRSITKPIRELTSATHAMTKGDLGQKVPVRSKDEIGELAESFNKMNDELNRSFNLRKQMTADIAHELRTPLSLIIGHAEAVHDGVLPPTKENFEIIREEAERLEKLVNDLRTLSLADAGELSLEYQPVDFNKLLSDIKAHYMVQFNQKRISLDLEPDSGILQATLDPTRISQVLRNILDNAFHYTPEGGKVTVTTKQLQNEIEIVIQDSGEGVTPEEASHLFDRFYRTDESRTRDDGGSGLGLAIAKSIVEMHNGTIRAESEKGRGLKTVIRLSNQR